MIVLGQGVNGCEMSHAKPRRVRRQRHSESALFPSLLAPPAGLALTDDFRLGPPQSVQVSARRPTNRPQAPWGRDGSGGHGSVRTEKAVLTGGSLSVNH
jgi:hypothetical protein